MKQDRYSLAYRSAETRQVLSWISAGECGCVLGLRGAGKSNFARFLMRPDVQQPYLDQEPPGALLAAIDLLALTEHTEWGVYELIFSSLQAQITPAESEVHAVEIEALYQEVRQNRAVLPAQRAVERLVSILCEAQDRRLVLCFDEFDAVFRELPPALFRCLRALRDAHKGQLIYIVLATHDLADLRADIDVEVDHFYRLVTRNVCGLGLYTQTDCRRMIEYLAAQRSINPQEEDLDRLAALSGGHAGLVKTITSLLWGPEYAGDLAALERSCVDEPAVQYECHKIWDSLSAEERAAVCMVENGDPVDPQLLRRLNFRGLLRDGRAAELLAPVLFSPFLRAFVRRQSPPPAAGTCLSRSPRFIQLDGRRIDTLTELEFELLCYLYERRGQVCTKDDLVEHVYRQRYGEMQGGVTDQSLQALVSRLREKIEPDRAHPRYVITVKGEGYRFLTPLEARKAGER